jgi:hypothetical protein
VEDLGVLGNNPYETILSCTAWFSLLDSFCFSTTAPIYNFSKDYQIMSMAVLGVILHTDICSNHATFNSFRVQKANSTPKLKLHDTSDTATFKSF